MEKTAEMQGGIIMIRKYIIRDREAGNVIATFSSKDEACNELRKYEEQDKIDGTYTPDFYEIIEE